MLCMKDYVGNEYLVLQDEYMYLGLFDLKTIFHFQEFIANLSTTPEMCR